MSVATIKDASLVSLTRSHTFSIVLYLLVSLFGLLKMLLIDIARRSVAKLDGQTGI